MLPLVTAAFLLGLLEPGPALGTHQRVLARLIRRDPPHGAGDPLHTTVAQGCFDGTHMQEPLLQEAF